LVGGSVERKGKQKMDENSVDWRENTTDNNLVEQKVVLKELYLVEYLDEYSVERKVWREDLKDDYWVGTKDNYLVWKTESLLVEWKVKKLVDGSENKKVVR
jgi:hypothetical protein